MDLSIISDKVTKNRAQDHRDFIRVINKNFSIKEEKVEEMKWEKV